MHELPAMGGKIIETVETIDYNGEIEQVCIVFTDGSTLVFTGTYNANHREGYINLSFELPTPPAIVTAQTRWPGE